MVQEIDGIGKFKFIDYMKDGEGVRVLRKFLKEVTIRQAEYSMNFLRQVGVPPFAYRERQLHTVIAPAISDISDAYLMESSVARKWTSINNDMDDSHGWVDYWCLYKNYNYYIELKHGFISYRSAEIRQSVKNEWEIACNQLDVIADEINEQKQYTQGIFKMAFHVLPLYIGSSNSDKFNFDTKKIYDIQLKAMNEISNIVQANWSCAWVLDDKFMDYCTYDNWYEKYPAVLFLANISEIQK